MRNHRHGHLIEKFRIVGSVGDVTLFWKLTWQRRARTHRLTRIWQTRYVSWAPSWAHRRLEAVSADPPLLGALDSNILRALWSHVALSRRSVVPEWSPAVAQGPKQAPSTNAGRDNGEQGEHELLKAAETQPEKERRYRGWSNEIINSASRKA